MTRLFLFASFLLVSGGIAYPQAPAPQPQDQRQAVRVGPGDMLSVKVFDVPEMEQTVRVADDGTARMSLIGAVPVAGKTPAEIAAWLEDAYVSRLLLRDPHVTVLVTEYATQGVAVMGEVMKPGTYPLLGPHTIVDLLSAAGGLTQAAGETASIAHQDGTTQEIVLDTNNPRHTIAVDVPVRPGDRIVVSRAAVVYVVGDVGKPGGFTMQNNGKLSVLQAIALASGANKTADLGKARILHKTEAGYEERQVALNRLLRSDLPDETLAPNDILFVPNSKLKSAIANGFSTAVQAAAMASIYRR